jgi:hypothetical protein
MKTLAELKTYFDTILKPEIDPLEKERIRIARKTTFWTVIAAIISLIFLVISLAVTPFAFIALGLAAVLSFIFIPMIARNYRSEFKNKVIARIIQFIDTHLNYDPAGFIPESTFMGSGIFRQNPDRYRGDDLVWGTLGQTPIRFSEIHAEYKTESTDSKGHRTTTWHTIFKGLFFIAEFNKKFKGSTYVLPDVAQNMFGNLLGNLFQSWNKSRGQLIKMEDIDFEKLFVVYGSDQIESRYILSTSLMKRITDYKKKQNKTIYLSFLNNQVTIAISYLKNLFEPRIYQTLFNFKVIEEYYTDLRIAIDLVDELNLNTRIWG